MPEVGFKFKGRTYTVERPCMFDDYCTPTDFNQWASHTGEWLAALAKKAVGVERQEHYLRIARRYADLVQRNQNCRVTCTAATKALVATAQLSKELAESWDDPVTADEVESDWGWIGTIGLPMLPGVGDIEEMIKAAFWQRYLPIIAAVGALFLLASSERRRA